MIKGIYLLIQTDGPTNGQRSLIRVPYFPFNFRCPAELTIKTHTIQSSILNRNAIIPSEI